MKLVNPNYLGIEIKYKFTTIVLKCKDFEDNYTESDYKRNGCYGCEHLTFDWNGASCDKDYEVIKLYFRMCDDGTIASGCSVFNTDYGFGKYITVGCAKCTSSYKSMGTIKCRNKYPISEETIRVG